MSPGDLFISFFLFNHSIFALARARTSFFAVVIFRVTFDDTLRSTLWPNPRRAPAAEATFIIGFREARAKIRLACGETPHRLLGKYLLPR